MGFRSSGRLLFKVLALVCVCGLGVSGRIGHIPEMNEYLRTLAALEQYRVWAAEDDGVVLPETDQPVEPGDHYEGVPRLVRLLRRIGDLASDIDDSASNVYDGALVTAVKRFQGRHGLEPDGRIDNVTLAKLNVPLEFRVHQLELALERWRRHPYNSSRPAIVLNLPEFRLRAFGPANDLELEMKIIVGEAPNRKTPLLSSELETVIFRPYWAVPLSIQQNELMPEIVKDRSFLRDNHIELVGSQGDAEGDVVSDHVIESLRAGRLRLRQTPGPKNVLGLVKFGFPNDFGIYMHDTSAPWLFSQPRRDFSHGCIRVERAEELAEWVLRTQPGWTQDRVIQVLQGVQTVGVQLMRPVQLAIIYVTAMVLENGEIDFFDDVYGEDAAFEKQLKETALRHSSHADASKFSESSRPLSYQAKK
jgi:L,D-transpeptidase YcbB